MENLVVVSAILPIHIKEENGTLKAEVSPGGLVTALKQVLKNKKALWVGWGGTPELKEEIKRTIFEAGKKEGFLLYPVSLTNEEITDFFNGFSNGIIWPLFHTFQAYCRFEPQYWEAYKKVNRKFAYTIKDISSEGDFIWVHDYHFFLLPKYIRELGINRKIAFFLHIPFPTPELFFKIPWRVEILEGLLEYDLIGFHTFLDRKNFLDCVDELVEGVNILSREPITEISYKGKRVKVGVFPISIDFELYDRKAREIEKYTSDKKIIFGVDRLDYTKGLIHKLKAYKRFLEKYPEYHKRVIFMQTVAPNIKKLPEYDSLKVEFEHLVSDINGTFGSIDWTPVYYVARRMKFDDLIRFYRSADVCWVNSIKDGMNLVGKEFAASNIDETGVLMLSEFAGAATELYKDVLLVNPYDIEKTADTLKEALELPLEKKREYMKNLREHIKKYNISWWGNTFLDAAFGKKIEDFPPLEEDYPLHEIFKQL